jgi:large repetitive protein
VEPAGNQAPSAVISPPSCAGLVCNFSSASSTDPNVGDTITRLWNWGDGTTSTSTSTSHTYAAAGTYTVTLTVTDGWGKATTVTRDVTVTSP